MAEKIIHQVKSPLPDVDGTPALLFRKMEVQEELGRPFRFDVDLLSEKSEVDSDKLLGHPMTISITMDDRTRYFHGIVSELVDYGHAGGYAQFHAVLRPWFWFLTRTNDCRIFQEKSVQDIFSSVCRDSHGFSDFRESLTGTYKKWEYCVQYRESDFDFLSRLLEQEGIYYFFEHTADKHTLVLADSYQAHAMIEGDSQVPYRPPGEAAVELEHISRWRVWHELQSTNYVLEEFDFTKPKASLKSQSQQSKKHGNASFEVYDYPGKYSETADGTTYAKVRLEELQSQYKRITANGDHRGLRAGGLFSLTEYPRKSENAEYLIVSTEILVESAEIEQFRDDAENIFDVSFNLSPSRVPFRPQRLTTKPTVHGPQTAIVVGAQGEEIWTDEYGRVKVQFHWDREGKSNEDSSCWIRVAQVWAGKQWGAMHILRIGQEVIVDFLEGDPDRPIITGRVYNEDQKPPYDLPANQTQSGLLSRSTKKGTGEHANELRFEDKKGEEEIYFHAEKDFSRVVENNDELKVGFEKKDTGSQTISIYQDRTTTIEKGDDSLTISTGSRKVEVNKDRKVTVKTGNDSLTVNSGNCTIEAKAGKIDITAAQSITLKVGTSSIKVDPTGITVSGVKVSVKGTATLEAKSPTTTVGGDALLMVKGGMVKIN